MKLGDEHDSLRLEGSERRRHKAKHGAARQHNPMASAPFCQSLLPTTRLGLSHPPPYLPTSPPGVKPDPGSQHPDGHLGFFYFSAACKIDCSGFKGLTGAESPYCATSVHRSDLTLMDGSLGLEHGFVRAYVHTRVGKSL